jgi:hypothetical protein
VHERHPQRAVGSGRQCIWSTTYRYLHRRATLASAHPDLKLAEAPALAALSEDVSGASSSEISAVSSRPSAWPSGVRATWTERPSSSLAKRRTLATVAGDFDVDARAVGLADVTAAWTSGERVVIVP